MKVSMRTSKSAPLTSVVLLVSLMFWQAGELTARQDQSAEWEMTGLSAPVSELFTPASGALFARTREGLMRSDDGGATWSAVALPAAPTLVTVHPGDHTILYAANADGLYRSADDAASWTLIRNQMPKQVVLSAADRDLAYVAEQGGNNPYHLARTRDSGMTWEDLLAPWGDQGQMCTWSLNLLVAHPSDPSRVFASGGCYAGRTGGAGLQGSLDQGETWSWLTDAYKGYPSRMIGGATSLPGRFYLVNRYPGSPGHSLSRTDDNGSTWTDATLKEPGAKDLGALTADPTAPDHIFGVFTFHDPQCCTTGLRTSLDGGQTWSRIDGPDVDMVSDLAVGIDGLNLYAATDRGVSRLPLR